jgi:hypothetical protein
MRNIYTNKITQVSSKLNKKLHLGLDGVEACLGLGGNSQVQPWNDVIPCSGNIVLRPQNRPPNWHHDNNKTDGPYENNVNYHNK